MVMIQAFDGVEVALSRYRAWSLASSLSSPTRRSGAAGRGVLFPYTLPQPAGRSGLPIGPTGEPRAAQSAVIAAAGCARLRRALPARHGDHRLCLPDRSRVAHPSRPAATLEHAGYEAAAACAAMVDEPIGHAIAGAGGQHLLRVGDQRADRHLARHARNRRDAEHLLPRIPGRWGHWSLASSQWCMGSVTSAWPRQRSPLPK